MCILRMCVTIQLFIPFLMALRAMRKGMKHVLGLSRAPEAHSSAPKALKRKSPISSIGAAWERLNRYGSALLSFALRGGRGQAWAMSHKL